MPRKPALEPQPTTQLPSPIVAFLDRRAPLLTVGLILLATLRIVSTYPVFSHTFDEPDHVACGMEWLERGTYRFETEHPPLSRIAEAAGPYLIGRRLTGARDPVLPATYAEGNAIFYAGNAGQTPLTLARIGNLPFFWIACATLWFWASRDFGRPTAVLAVFCFSFTPPVLAHAGLATTDLALTAFLCASFAAGIAWARRPTLLSTLPLGLLTGLAFSSKFSSLAYLPAAWGACLVLHLLRQWRALPQIARQAGRLLPLAFAALAVAFLVIWAFYRFSFGPSAVFSFRVPCPELFDGVRDVALHNQRGHHAYLLGQLRQTGFWDFFPVALAVKTPLALLVLAGWGAFLAWKRRSSSSLWIPCVLSAAILAVGMSARINIGLRHILPIYLGLSILAAAALVQGLERFRASRITTLAVAVLAFCLTASSLLAHPDYLAYFNLLAGGHPERILVDSDLDWGQDIKRLGERLQALHADHVTFTPFSRFDPAVFHFPPMSPNDANAPAPGWNAVSFTAWKHEQLRWPDHFDATETVGGSIGLYYFKPGDPALKPASEVDQVLRDFNQRK